MSGILCDNKALADAWYAVARSIDVGGAPVKATVLQHDIVLYRTLGGEIVAAPDRCPHREAPLSAGTMEAGCLVCPYHGWVFGDDGKCVRVPSSAAGVPAPPRAHLTRYHAEEKYGLVFVCIGEPSAPIFTIDQDADSTFRRINTPVDPWKASATRMADNFCDITHFPYVHVGTFGRGQDPFVPKVELGPLDNSWFGYSYEVKANNDSSLGSLASGQTGEVVNRKMSTGFDLPFNVRSTITYENGLSHIILMLSTPIDDVNSYFTFVIWRNDDFSVAADDVIRFDMAIGAEDKRMLEQVPGVLSLDLTETVSVQADKCSVEWRRQLIAYMSPTPTERLAQQPA